ncbi:hypothetical protein [Massilia sp. BSC265]|uniref:hypothetical protein n=1 Tax=Massilia sp. BSC265 TaxID=1549812 RepID=UPI0004E8A5E2|nr:hypothetical protein [Massilia sp. BSC265]KFI07378.1 hypothetical protein JN27_10580 [Massilia sp. BSC265]
MKKLLPLIFLGTALSAGAASLSAPAPAMKVHDLASGFTTVFDRNAGKSEREFVQDFKATVASRFPGFYGAERFKGQRSEAQREADLVQAFAEFPGIREAYVKKVARFTQDLPAHVASFRAAFPDYPATTDIWFLHSLGEMDGGSRTIDGKRYFIFGADSMVKYHGDGDEAAFFHHELFHDYHGMECKPRPIWASLWSEGLATYVAKQMNPSANNSELLLDFPPNLVADTRKALGRALEDLHGKLDSEDRTDYAGLFYGSGGDKTGLPARRGYYLGYLVAEEIGKTMSMQQMAKLDCGAARTAVVGAVKKLRTAHAASGQ